MARERVLIVSGSMAAPDVVIAADRAEMPRAYCAVRRQPVAVEPE